MKRTRKDVMKALTWREGSPWPVGGMRYRCIGIVESGRYYVAYWGKGCSKTGAEGRVKDRTELESAVASMIAVQPAVARVL